VREDSNLEPELEQPTADTPDCDPPARTYHGELALQHFAGKLSGQPLTLLCFLWACAAAQAWDAQPKVFVAGSRLAAIAPNAQVRSRILTKLAKLGAIRKGKRTFAGREYILLRPPFAELSPDLRHAIETIAPSDYRFDHAIEARPTVKPKSVKQSKRRTPNTPRKKLSAYLKGMQLGWRNLAMVLRDMAGSDQIPNYKKGSVEVEAFASWLHMHHASRPVIVNKLYPLLKAEHPLKPTGNELRFVFEGNTEAKALYLAHLAEQIGGGK